MSEPLPSSPALADAPASMLNRPQQRILALLEVLLCSSLPTQLLVAIILNAAGLSSRTQTDQLSLPYVVTLSLTDSALVIAMMVALTRVHGESPWLLWRGRRPMTRELALGLALVPIAIAIVVVLMGSIQRLAPWLHNVPENPLEALAAGTPGEATLFAIMAILAGGVREELQRAFLFLRFERHLGGTTVGVVALSLAFGAGHVMQGWDAAVATGVLGALWTIVYIRRRSSVAPIVSHAGFNSIEVLRAAIGAS